MRREGLGCGDIMSWLAAAGAGADGMTGPLRSLSPPTEMPPPEVAGPGWFTRRDMTFPRGMISGGLLRADTVGVPGRQAPDHQVIRLKATEAGVA